MSPPLRSSGVPSGARELELLVKDRTPRYVFAVYASDARLGLVGR